MQKSNVRPSGKEQVKNYYYAGALCNESENQPKPLHLEDKSRTWQIDEVQTQVLKPGTCKHRQKDQLKPS